MKVKFVKKVRDAEKKDKFFQAGKEYDLKKERAEKAIKRNLAVEVKEPKATKSTQEKTEAKTIKK